MDVLRRIEIASLESASHRPELLRTGVSPRRIEIDADEVGYDPERFAANAT
jgi:hypothetical protein